MGTVVASVVATTAVVPPSAASAPAKPTVTRLSATTDRLTGGARITVQGQNLTRVRSVLFGRTAGRSPRVSSARSLTVIVPAHAAGLVDVRVVTAAGTSPVTRVDRFTYVAPPRVTALSPAVGLPAGGETVRISGPEVGRATAVRFGTTPATALRRLSATTVTVRAPVHARADVHVTVTTPYGTSAVAAADRYQYRAIPPPVSHLELTSVTRTSATLRWQLATTSGVGGVSIRRLGAGTDPGTDGDGQELARVPVGTYTWTDTTLRPGFGYTYSLATYADSATAGGPVSARTRIDVTAVSDAGTRPGTLPGPTGISTTPASSNGGCGGSGALAGWIGVTPTITVSGFARNDGTDTSPVAIRFVVSYDTFSGQGREKHYLIGPDDPAGLSAPIPASGGTGSLVLDTDLIAPYRDVEVLLVVVFADGTYPAQRFSGPQDSCYIDYDPIVPTTPSVSSVAFPHDGSGTVHTGEPGRFDVGYDQSYLAGGYSGYDHVVYSLSRDDLFTTRAGSTPTGMQRTAVDFDVTPARAGPNTLWVSAVNRAGTPSPPARWDFVVTDPPPPVADAPPYPRLGDSDDSLSAVACASRERCVAIGGIRAFSVEEQYLPGTGVLVQTWTAGGSSGTWTPTIVPGPARGGVRDDVHIACPTVTSCTAVASTETPTGRGLYVASLTGTTWTVREDAPVVPGSTDTEITALTCRSATACTAAGRSRSDDGVLLPFVTVLAGTTWTTTRLPTPVVAGAPAEAAIDAVDCVDATHCRAVGRYAAVARADGTPPTWAMLVETLTGSAWTASQPAVAVDQLPYATITCPTATECTARDGLQSLALRAGTWTSTGALPSSDFALGGPVVCAGSSVCRAVVQPDDGSSTTVATFADGAWTRTLFPGIGEGGSNDNTIHPTGLACVDATHCAVVGNNRLRAFTSTLSGPPPWYTQYLAPSNAQVRLDQVSCVTDTYCLAAGRARTYRAYLTMLVGSTWTYRDVPLPADAAGDDVSVFGVSCAAVGWCAVLGRYNDGRYPSYHGLYVAVLADGVWTSTRVLPWNGRDYYGSTGQLSCPQVGHCVATANGDYGGLVLTLDAGTWTSARLGDGATNDGTRAESLGAVSCASPTSCLVLRDSYQAAQGWRLDAGTWTRTPISVPGQGLSHAESVSCPSESSCTVVGRSYLSPDGPGYGDMQSFASTLTDGVWTTSVLPGSLSRSTTTPYNRVAVSCTGPTTCFAVGRSIGGIYPVLATQYAAQLTPTGWAQLVTVTPDGTYDPGLSAVSCLAGGVCVAVGQTNYLVSTLPFVEVFVP